MPNELCSAHAGLVASHDALAKTVSDGHQDTVRWRDQHIEDNKEAFDRVFAELKADREENGKRWDRLANRLPLWATLMFTIGGSIVGALVAIIVMLANHILG